MERHSSCSSPHSTANEASQRVLEKADFKKEGIVRKDTFTRGESFWDVAGNYYIWRTKRIREIYDE